MKNVAAAIDFGTSKIVTLLAESGGFTRCDIVGSGTVPYDGYLDGAWNTPAQVAQAIRDSINAAEVEAKRRIEEAYVGVPCEYIRVLSAEAEVQIAAADGRVNDEDIDRVQDAAADALNIRAQGGLVIHRSPSWFTVDGGKKNMSPLGAKGQTLRAQVSFIIADPAFTEDVRSMLSGMGVATAAFLSPSMGAALLLLPLEERDRASMFVDMGYLNTEVSVVEGDALTYHAVLPIGGGHITAALAEGLEITMKAAEQLKREYIFMPDEFDNEGDPEVVLDDGSSVTFPRDLVQGIVEKTVDEFVSMLESTLDDARERLGARSQIFMTGGGLAMMRGGREYVAEKLNRSVKVPMARAAKLNSPRFASALGLVDLVFDSIDQQSSQEDSIAGKLSGGIKNLFHR